MIKERDILALLLTRGLGPKRIGRIMNLEFFYNSQVDLSLMSTAEMIQHMNIKPVSYSNLGALIGLPQKNPIMRWNN